MPMDAIQLDNKPSVLDPDEKPQFYRDLHTDLMFLNLGPSHPASHGTLRIFAALDGETIAAAVTEIGYLHRGFEKTCEHRTYNQCIPYTDRLNYCSAIMNNVGFAKAVEKLLDIEITDRCKFIRVIVSELMRVVDHCICIGTNLVDIGALSNFWFMFNKREQVYTILERLTGARLTNSYTRIGGLYRDLYDGFEEDVLQVCGELAQASIDVQKLIAKNRIFVDRTQGICILSPERAISYGFTGPNLRACGVPLDLRKTQPYYYYDTFDFDIALGSTGDTYDRVMIRFIEMGVDPDHSSGHQGPAGWPDQRRRQARDAARQARHLPKHRRPDQPLQARLRRRQDAAGRGLRFDRSRQWRAGVLYCLGRVRLSLSHQVPATLFLCFQRLPRDDRRGDGRRCDRHPGLDQHHRGRARALGFLWKLLALA